MKRSMYLLGIVFSLGLCPVVLYAQCTNTCGSNLIPNPSYETVTGNCTTADIQLYTNQTPVQSWYGTEQYISGSMAGSTPDYYSACAGSTNSANNVCFTGSARVGVFTKTSFSNGREYVQAQLTSPLIAGKTYCFSMVVKSKVGAAGNILSSCDGIGAWFHNLGLIDINVMNGGVQFIGPGTTLNAQPQVENATGNLIGSSCVTVTGTFCAQGGESWIVLGNFKDDASTQISGSNPSNYMYIDNTSLYEVCSTPLNVLLSANPTNVCPGSCSVLTATASGGSGAYTYLWSPGNATTNTVSVCPGNTTTYTVTVSSSAGCATPLTFTSAITVTVSSVSVSINNPGAICAGQSTILTATPSTGGGTYLWMPGGATTPSITVSPGSTTTYTCTYTLGSCSNSSTSIVTVNPIPTIGVNSTTICNGSSATLTATGATTYSWSTGSAVNPLIVSPASTTVYTVTGTTSGCSGSATSTVTVNPVPTINVNSSSICNGSSATLTATGATAYSWSTGSTVNPLIVSPTSTTVYTVTGTTSGCSASAISTVTVLANITVSNINATCNPTMTGYTVSFEINGGDASTYTVSGGTGSVSSTSPYIFTSALIPAGTPSYSFVVNDANNCSPQTVSGTQNCSCPASAVMSGGGSACAGSSVDISIALSGTGPWNLVYTDGVANTTVNGINSSPYILSTTVNGNYSLVSMSDANCVGSVSGSATVSINPIPIVTVNSSIVCEGSSATLTSGGADSYTWSDSSIVNPLVVSPTSTTVYTVTGTTSGCTGSATSTVTVNPVPTINVNSVTICNGSSATLTATGAVAYLWSTGSTASTLTVSPTSTTNYTVTGTDNGCSDTAIAIVTVNNCSSSSPCTNTCGPSLIANGGFETPTGNCTTADIQLYTNQTPVQNWYGTEAFNPSQMAGSTPDYMSPCAGSTNSANNSCITGSARVGVFTHTSFSNGREYVQSQLNSPLIAGKTYCFSMVVKSRVGAAGNLLSSCDGIGAWFHNQGLVDIQTMNGGNQFLGSGSIVNANPQVENPSGNLINGSCTTVTGTFCAVGGEQWIVIGNFRDDANTQMSGSNPSNYMYIDDVNLFEICSTPLNAIILANQTNVCPGTCVSLSSDVTGGNSNYAYTWMPGNLTADSVVVCPNITTTYSLTVVSLTSCGFPETVVDSITVVVNNCFSGVVANGANVCNGQCANISAQAIGATNTINYLWQPGNLTGSNVNVCPTSTTIYTVTASDSTGLSFTDTCVVNVNQVPIANAGLSDTICAGNSTTLSGSGNGTYNWNTNPPQTTQNITVNPSATTDYILTVSNGACSSTDTVTVSIVASPVVTFQSNNITCNGLHNGSISASIMGGTQPISFSWMPGNINATSLSGLSAGAYTFTLTDHAGCNFTQVTTITEPAALTAQIAGASEICAGTSATLNAQVSGGNSLYTYNWHGAGPNVPVITVSPNVTTNYSVTVVDQEGCQSIANHQINVNNPPFAYFTGGDTLCVPFNVSFSNQSSGAIAYQWNFGDGGSSDFDNPTHSYTVGGVFDVSLIAISSNGCRDTFLISNDVQAVNVPFNSITASANEVSEYEPVVEYAFSSTNSQACTINFGDSTIIDLCEGKDYAHYYKNTGTYCVYMTSVNALGCSYTSTVCVTVYPEFTFYVPNAFTPNADGDDDAFTGYGSNFKDFEMEIFDRWGELIYKTNDYSKPWNGIPSGKSVVAQQDVYIYKIVVSDLNGVKKEFTGHVSLIR